MNKNTFLSVLVIICIFTAALAGGSYEFMPDELTVNAADNDRKVLYVGENQPYQSVQDAVYAANNGDTVFIKSGTYSEIIQINKDYLIIQGEDISTTIVGNNSKDATISICNATGVTLKGLSIKSEGNCISLKNSADCSIKQCKIEAKICGINVDNFSNKAVIDECDISGAINGYGIKSSANAISVLNSNIYNNDNGIYISPASEVLIEKNRIYNNKYNGCELRSVSGLICKDNNFSSNSTGIYWFNSSDQTKANGKLINNELFFNKSNCAYLNNISNCLIENNYMYIQDSSKWTNIGAYYLAGGIVIKGKSSNNTITKNVFSNYNYDSGIQLDDSSSNNKIYWNDFIGCGARDNSENQTNIWDLENRGNYWSKYSGKDENGDGIGDTPYLIEAVNIQPKDHYPLMKNQYIVTEPPVTPTLTPTSTPTATPTSTPTRTSSGSSLTCNVGAPHIYCYKNGDRYLSDIDLSPEIGDYDKAVFDFTFGENPSGFIVNIGDSITNNAGGGDAGHYSNDSEIDIVDGTLNIYLSDYGRINNDLLFVTEPNAAPANGKIRIEISNNTVTYYNFTTGVSKTWSSPYIFALNGQKDDQGPVNYMIYAAVNQVIYSNNRFGSGVVDTKITLLSSQNSTPNITPTPTTITTPTPKPTIKPTYKTNTNANSGASNKKPQSSASMPVVEVPAVNLTTPVPTLLSPTASPTVTPLLSAEATPIPYVLQKDTKDHWAKEYIDLVVSKGIMGGKGNGIFAPNDYTTRAECAKVTVELLKKESNNIEMDKFSDLSKKDWFYSYIYSAYNEGLMVGNPDGTFCPNTPVTRQDLALIFSKILIKYCSLDEVKAMNTANDVAINSNSDVDVSELKGKIELPFNDTSSISDYALNGVATASNYGLFTGKPNNLFDPKGKTTRAELATILYKLITKYEL